MKDVSFDDPSEGHFYLGRYDEYHFQGLFKLDFSTLKKYHQKDVDIPCMDGNDFAICEVSLVVGKNPSEGSLMKYIKQEYDEILNEDLRVTGYQYPIAPKNNDLKQIECGQYTDCGKVVQSETDQDKKRDTVTKHAANVVKVTDTRVALVNAKAVRGQEGAPIIIKDADGTERIVGLYSGVDKKDEGKPGTD